MIYVTSLFSDSHDLYFYNLNNMKKNMGSTDKTLRVLVALLIAGLFYANVISGATAVILLLLAGVFILTSFVSFCPLYLPFGLSTRNKK
jgi:hypothetical protein